MDHFQESMVLTHSGVMVMLNAAVKKAEQLNVPQCIVIVDSSGQVLGEIRMTGAKFLSRKSARSKALTAASIRAPSSQIPEPVRLTIGLATQGDVTGLSGGLPIFKNGHLLGGIGVGSGSADQDIEVANAALLAIGADARAASDE